MNPEKIKEIEKVINQEIKSTIIAIDKYKELTKPISPENSIGRVSRMDAINNKSVMEEALRKLEKKLHKLKFVKDRIQDENFGTCINCNKEIPIARMLIIPQSRKCVHCA